jgi:ribosomal protein S10
MFFHLKVSSKDNKVLEKFVQFLSKLETSPIVLKYFSQQKKRKFITVLKSPHINKTAQEQFEFRYYNKQFLINSFKPSRFLLVLKKIKNLSFPGIKLEVKGLFDKNKNDNSFSKMINPDNVILKKKGNLKVKKQQHSKSFQKKYIQLFDFYGEICLKNVFHL